MANDGGQNLQCVMGLSPPQPIQPGDEETECRQAGGTVQVVGSGGGGGGICFVRDVLTRALGEQIMQVGGTYGVACSFRDDILANSHVGRRMLEIYYSSLPITFQIVNANLDVLFQAIKTWRSIWLVAVAMVSLAKGSAAEDAHLITYTDGRHQELVRLLDMMRAGTRDAKYLAALDEVDAELRQYVGWNAGQILKHLRRD